MVWDNGDGRFDSCGMFSGIVLWGEEMGLLWGEEKMVVVVVVVVEMEMEMEMEIANW